MTDNTPIFHEKELVMFKGLTHYIETLSECNRYAVISRGYKRKYKQRVKTSDLRLISRDRSAVPR